jgi:hypothetical protein
MTNPKHSTAAGGIIFLRFFLGIRKRPCGRGSSFGPLAFEDWRLWIECYSLGQGVEAGGRARHSRTSASKRGGTNPPKSGASLPSTYVVVEISSHV